MKNLQLQLYCKKLHEQIVYAENSMNIMNEQVCHRTFIKPPCFFSFRDPAKRLGQDYIIKKFI